MLTAELLVWQRRQAETQALTLVLQIWSKYKTSTNEQECKNRLNTVQIGVFFSLKDFSVEELLLVSQSVV